MKQGDKVHIVSTVVPGVWNKPREMVLTFIAEDGDDYIFSARPEAGTQVIPKNQVAKMFRVSDGTPIMMPRTSGEAGTV